MGKGKKKGAFNKNNKVTLNLNDFQNLTSAAPSTGGSLNWADESSGPVTSSSSYQRAPQVIELPSAPKASREIDVNSVPEFAPFTARVRNLPFDCDENDLANVFGKFELTDVKIVMDQVTSRPKGYAFVEFKTRACLIEALQMQDLRLESRQLGIEVSTRRTNDGGGRYGAGRGGSGGASGDGDWRQGQQEPREERDLPTDWRSGPRSEPREQREPPREGRREYQQQGGQQQRDAPPRAEMTSDWRSGPREEPRGVRDSSIGSGRGYDRDQQQQRPRAARDDTPRNWRDSAPDGPPRGFERDASYNDRSRDGGFERRGGGGGGYDRREGGGGGFGRSSENAYRPSERKPLNLLPKSECAVETSSSAASEAGGTGSSERASAIFNNAVPADVSKQALVMDRIEKKLGGSRAAAGGALPVAAAAGFGGAKVKKSNPFGNAKPVDTAAKMKQLEAKTAAMFRVRGDEEKPAAASSSLQQQRGGGGGGSNRAPLAKSWRRGENEDGGTAAAAGRSNPLGSKQPQMRIEQQKAEEPPCFVSKSKFDLLATDEDE